MNGNRPKRVYELTSKGKDLLESTVDSLARICCKIENNGKNKHYHLKILGQKKTSYFLNKIIKETRGNL